MMQRILAPTDGSAESEKALPLATQIARAQNAELLLVSVIDEPNMSLSSFGERAMTPERFEETLRASETQARSHLLDLESQIKPNGVRVRSDVRRGPIAARLLDWEIEERPDLLVIATHGRTRLARFALGSVADRMVREGSAPVLVVRRSTSPPRNLETALVMLDGSGLGEQALAIAETLAHRPLQTITLFRTVADPEDRRAAQTYLDGAGARFVQSGVKVTTAVDVGDPRIVAERAAKGLDLVILATHGRGGFDRWRHGSVADYVVRYVDQPVLLVRADDSRGS